MGQRAAEYVAECSTYFAERSAECEISLPPEELDVPNRRVGSAVSQLREELDLLDVEGQHAHKALKEQLARLEAAEAALTQHVAVLTEHQATMSVRARPIGETPPVRDAAADPRLRQLQRDLRRASSAEASASGSCAAAVDAVEERRRLVERARSLMQSANHQRRNWEGWAAADSYAPPTANNLALSRLTSEQRMVLRDKWRAEGAKGRRKAERGHTLALTSPLKGYLSSPPSSPSSPAARGPSSPDGSSQLSSPQPRHGIIASSPQKERPTPIE